MKNVVKTVLIVTLVLSIALLVNPSTATADRGGEGGRGNGPVVYVTSMGLYFDAIVTADPVPWKGPFQQLFPPGTNPVWPEGKMLSTEFGPGVPGHHGGRWWVDVNGNGEQDAEDHFFVCPLLGPGRDAP